MKIDMSTDACDDPKLRDRTPDDFFFKKISVKERFKRYVRPILYPILNVINNSLIWKRFSTPDFKPDLWLTDMRGNDENRNRARVNRAPNIKGSRILVIGCGLGRELESWLVYEPEYVMGIDLFNYVSAWEVHRQEFEKGYPLTEVNFEQIDILTDDLSHLGTFDIIASDAVLEHVTDLDLMMVQLKALMRNNCIFYAGFGPLWYTWGGDHVSGYDKLSAGYNHLLLGKREWLVYARSIEQNYSDAEEGNHWIDEGLFSKLRPTEYLESLDGAGLKRISVIAIHNRKAAQFERDSREDFKTLLEQHSRLDLSTLAMVTIYQNKS
jgi:SAM-dependent methyltransferase